ncbi:hypothetical protein IEO21_07080 [Rhodonia placenta]|uniref:CCAAT-binding factor domain-containing protein n=1 Tax=Rhodonia placenta TaxID=104341 RepID=A0A8H7U0P2_9APHY|nr:hypothetical protein IEO21_07080 [Postia placenta]
MSASRSSLPSKKRKSTNDAVLPRIRELETLLTAAVSNNASLNALADLLDVALDLEDASHLCKAIYALYRVFVLIIYNGLLTARHSADENSRAVHAWLVERLNAYITLLCGLLKDTDSTLKSSALQILFSLQKHLSTAATKSSSDGEASQPQFHMSHFRKIVNALLRCPPSPRDKLLDADVMNTFLQTLFDVYDDIRWFVLREAGTILTTQMGENDSDIARNVLSILEGLTTFPTEPSELNTFWVEELSARPPLPKSASTNDESAKGDGAEEENKLPPEDDWRAFFDQDPAASDVTKTKAKASGARVHTLTLHQSLHSLQSHRAVFTRTWLALLSRLTTRADALRVLNVLHRGVIPHLTRPVLIMDWVGSCVDYGASPRGTVGLLALNALFTLMKDYNLDYPSFYTRLYTFLDRDVLHLKHRARFFRLTELFLSSTHLPAALVAAFVKRLSRLSLNAPPAAIVMIIPFTYNLLKRHPALMHMIHRVADDDERSKDPFSMAEPVPALSGALDSSLWELYTHTQHYHSVVATLACIFSEAFTRPSYALEDFLDHTYGTLIDSEIQKRIRKEPAMDTDARSSNREDVTAELWAF